MKKISDILLKIFSYGIIMNQSKVLDIIRDCLWGSHNEAVSSCKH